MARLRDVHGVGKVVVAVAGVIGLAKGEEEGVEPICQVGVSVRSRKGEERQIAPRSKSMPSMFRKLSKMRPTHLRSSSGV